MRRASDTLSIVYEEKQEHILVETKDAQQSNTQDTSRAQSNIATMSEATSQRLAFSMLKSPTTCSIKGIKLYSDNDIETSTGKEKERRIFWNRRAKELSKENVLKKQICTNESMKIGVFIRLIQ